MTQNILVLSGKKQAGKNTISNYLHGLIMEHTGGTRTFNVNDQGQLEVWAVDEEGNEGMGILDVTRQDAEFAAYASQRIWPFVKNYSFADQLKQFLINVFDLRWDHCYGTDKQKNTPTHLKWSDVAFTLPPRTVGELKKTDKYNKFMTGREVMSHFGTDVCRKIYNDCWANALVKQVQAENVPIAIVSDCRFPNEVEAFQKVGAKVVRLTRKVDNSKHISETALDKYKDFDYVLDNAEMSIDDQNEAIVHKLREWGWFTVESEDD